MSARRTIIMHTPSELLALVNEAVRLCSGGNVSNVMDAFRASQHVLAPSRRRIQHIGGMSKIKHFSILLKQRLPNLPNTFKDAIRQATPTNSAHQDAEIDSITTPATEHSEFSEIKKIREMHVRWTAEEKTLLIKEAARLFVGLITGSRLEALRIAQKNILPPDRHRPYSSIGGDARLRVWYFSRLDEEIARLKAEKLHPPITPLAAPQRASDETNQQSAAVGRNAPLEPAIAPSAGLAEATKSITSTTSPFEPIASMLVQQWAPIRERLVQEIASIVIDGIQRGLHVITASSSIPGDTQSPSDDATISSPMHVPYLAGNQAAPKQSVLIVGLKGSQVEIIRQRFQKQMDLRFCSSDESKDQLRAQAGAADVSVLFTDFISHSHQDIVKARAKRYVLAGGGMTRLAEALQKISTPDTSTPQAAH